MRAECTRTITFASPSRATCQAPRLLHALLLPQHDPPCRARSPCASTSATTSSPSSRRAESHVRASLPGTRGSSCRRMGTRLVVIGRPLEKQVVPRDLAPLVARPRDVPARRGSRYRRVRARARARTRSLPPWCTLPPSCGRRMPHAYVPVALSWRPATEPSSTPMPEGHRLLLGGDRRRR